MPTTPTTAADDCVACHTELAHRENPPEGDESLGHDYAWLQGAAYVIAAAKKMAGAGELEIPLCELHRAELVELLDAEAILGEDAELVERGPLAS